jgi:gliotoxin biosynthesis cytochrome P450 monooxygenase
MMLNYL